MWTYTGYRANNSVSQLEQAAMPCIDDHQLKNTDFEVVGEFASACSQIVSSFLMFIILLEVADLAF